MSDATATVKRLTKEQMIGRALDLPTWIMNSKQPPWRSTVRQVIVQHFDEFAGMIFWVASNACPTIVGQLLGDRQITSYDAEGKLWSGEEAAGQVLDLQDHGKLVFIPIMEEDEDA